MIYFASDIHLGGGGEAFARANEQRFVAWLDRVARDAEAIVLAGDVFDFWFEKGRHIPDGYDRVLDKFREVTGRGIRLIFFTGNHDMWLNGYFERECGMEVHTKPQTMQFKGKRVFVAHGDNINIGCKIGVRLLNIGFRSRMLRWIFETVCPYEFILRLGRAWSAHSLKKHASDTDTNFDETLTEPLIEYAREYRKTHEVDHFVFGHMHFPRNYCKDGLHVVNLGGWEKCPSYAVLDDRGELTLKMLDE
ncbi:UDP-2,3-diacylglucosamine diphosphatase [Alistipes sp.]|uniref:UDP-2,3-diacylglucosamine diphosphatase n=1 Tax=Alistipes sp. TaxID=1872444 RepID=UPI003AF01749